MLAKGNGTPLRCAQNLVQITTGEVPFDRTRGADATLIDSSADVKRKHSNIINLITIYEPRVNPAEINSKHHENGDFSTILNVKRSDE